METYTLVGVAEIADLLKLTRARVHQIIADDRSFPEPAATLRSGRIWIEGEVRDWAKTKHRACYPPSPSE